MTQNDQMEQRDASEDATESSDQRNTGPRNDITLSANPILSLLSLPFTIFLFLMTNFREYITQTLLYDTEESEILKSIPQQQDRLQKDVNNVKETQMEIDKDINMLMTRVKALEERRKKREDSMK
mmetsp:Transcript_18431/g.22566  ORF Transcript_18431/g.22566 Transcript_18431/m.22566 type:complete len:125 (+) Transcript_18431:46-420(+)